MKINLFLALLTFTLIVWETKQEKQRREEREKDIEQFQKSYSGL